MIERIVGIISRVGHPHIGKGAHHSNIFNAIVRCTCSTGRQTYIRAGDFDIQARIANRDGNLVQSTAGCEGCERARKWE